jgi:hypothetical protein
MEFTVTSTQILGFFTFVGAVWGFIKIIKEINKPNVDLKNKVEEHERDLKDLKDKYNEIDNTDKLILQGLLVVINHDITGNGVNQLKATRDEIQEYLINK